MDFARSCYKRRMRFVAGDLATFAEATWYFCAATAKPFPGVHRFGSANWDNERGEFSDLGDDAQKPQTYYSGRRTNLSDGTRFAGSKEFFERGCPGPGLLARGAGLTPVECLSDPFGLSKGGSDRPVSPASGGLRKGGFQFSPVVPIVCGSLPLTINVDVIAATGPPSVHVGSTFTITWNGFSWVGGIGALFTRINIVANCSGDDFGVQVLFFIVPATPIFHAFTAPLDVTGMVSGGGDTATIRVYQ